MKKVLSIVLSCVILISSLCAGLTVFAQENATNADIKVTYYQTNARSMFDMVNAFRTGSDAWYWNESDTAKVVLNNLSKYTYDYNLEKIAMQRAAEIAVKYDHVRPNGEWFYTAYDKYYGCGENIAAGYTSASAVFEGWKEENDKYDGQGHRRNMLSSSFTSIGIACVKYNGVYYWVQEFRYPVYSAAATPAVDGETSVNMDILNSSITSSTVSASVTEINLNSGDSVDLPSVTSEMKVSGSWPSGATITGTVSAEWSVADASIAKISNGRIVAVKTGSTTLTATVNGKKISVPVTVSCSHNVVVDAAVAPTCQSTGLTEGSHCSICGTVFVEQQILPKSDHSYQSTVVEQANCIKEGRVEYKCTVCGDTYYETIAKTAHTPVTDKAVAPTCQATGLTEGSHCSVCGTVLVKQETVPMIDHKYESIVIKEATCLEEGTVKYTCAFCGDSYTETIAKTAHTPVTDKAVAPTCQATGLTEGSHCSVCGTVLVKQETVPMIDHKYESTVIKEATCLEEGTVKYTCAFCGDSYTETIAKTAHTPVTDKAVAPTCQATGLTEGSHCSVCGTVLVKQEIVPMTAHTVVTDAAVAATCTSTGLTEGSHCSVCGTVFVKQEVVPMTAHTVVTDAAVAATCTSTGLTEGSHCSVCGTVLVKQETVPMTAHTVVTDAAVAATCTSTGLTEGSHCSVCETVLVKQELIPALAHNFVYTANEDGTHTKTCQTCALEEIEACVKVNQGDHAVCKYCGAEYELEITTEPSTVVTPSESDENENTTNSDVKTDTEQTTGSASTEKASTEKSSTTTTKPAQRNTAKISPATGNESTAVLCVSIAVMAAFIALLVFVKRNKKTYNK